MTIYPIAILAATTLIKPRYLDLKSSPLTNVVQARQGIVASDIESQVE
jgi:hypothetical protein